MVLALMAWNMLGKLVSPLAFSSLFSFGSTSESSNTQIREAVTKEKEVVLLGLGIQGISEKNERSDFHGIDVPGSGRLALMEYSFQGKLGIDGKSVDIEQTGEKNYVVSIPQFIFIGHDDVNFRMVTEDHGALSWVTPEIDTIEMVNEILNDDTKNQYLASHDEELKEQAINFYEGIIEAVDPEIAVDFKFSS